MKNFNFSFLLAVYLTALATIFVRIQTPDAVLLYGMLLSPLVVLAFRSRGVKIKQKIIPEKYPTAMLSHILALVGAVLFFIFVYHYSTGKEPLQFFGNFRLGWTPMREKPGMPIPNEWPPLKAMQLLFITIILAASAMSIWTSYRFTNTRSVYFREIAPQVFFAGASEPVRIMIYLYIFTFLWSLGASVISLVWRDQTLSLFFLVTGRACVPLAVLLLVAMLRLPLAGAGAAAAFGLITYLMTINVGTVHALAFVLPPVAAAAIFFGARSVYYSRELGLSGTKDSKKANAADLVAAGDSQTAAKPEDSDSEEDNK